MQIGMLAMSRRTYRVVDLTVGWALFVVASVVYLLTMEPTGSFWDCGEFIACANGIMVGHPPGAPFFMLLMRLFTMFAPTPESVGVLANAMSALASGATIMFLYWTIAHFARRMVSVGADGAVQMWDGVLVVGAGVVGALCYTFSDTFWFSAVEGEVYALSSLFTAVVFWAVLKWENEADEPHSARWLVLIALLMGLSIGVHLLNLLAIPAIVLIYYFKKFSFSWWGVFKALLIGGGLLLVVLYGVIQGLVVLAAYADLLFTNVFGAPFWTGAAVFGALLGGLLLLGIAKTQRRRKYYANLALLCVAMLLLGYSSYAVIVIRSKANPTLDQNGVENLFSLRSYLNREQYGDRPLVTGPYYNSVPVDVKEDGALYAPRGGRYVKVRDKFDYVYDERMTTVFPRMWSSMPQHVRGYQEWVKIKGRPVVVRNRKGENETIQVPTFGENLQFLFRYQLGHMYWRYFMWNFSGRQNDYQPYGRDVYRGNWISGLSPIDNWRLGDQRQLPEIYRNNKARNRYFMLPLLFGLLGALYHFRRHPKHASVVLCLFVLTGIAIVVYLNQKPFEPRERDYSYAGSFYAYAVWVGLGVMGLSRLLRGRLRPAVAVSASISAAMLGVPILMGVQNWDDHDRSGRYVSIDFARNMLRSIGPHGILFTYADNDTFPLWYALEAEKYRTDARICNLTYLSGDWYADVMSRAAYESAPLPFGVPREKYWEGVNDRVSVESLLDKAVSLGDAMDFVLSDDPRTKLPSRYAGEDPISFFPTNRVFQIYDRERMKATYPAQFTDSLGAGIEYELPEGGMYKNGFLVYGLVNGNKWARPLYFSPMMPEDMMWGLNRHFARCGLVQGVEPVTHDAGVPMVDTAASWRDLMELYSYRSIADSGVYIDETCRRMLPFYVSAFAETARALYAYGQRDRAWALVQKVFEAVPPRAAGWSYEWIDLVALCFDLGNRDAGHAALMGFAKENIETLAFEQRLRPGLQGISTTEISLAYSLLGALHRVAARYGDSEAQAAIEAVLE